MALIKCSRCRVKGIQSELQLCFNCKESYMHTYCDQNYPVPLSSRDIDDSYLCKKCRLAAPEELYLLSKLEFIHFLSTNPYRDEIMCQRWIDEARTEMELEPNTTSHWESMPCRLPPIPPNAQALSFSSMSASVHLHNDIISISSNDTQSISLDNLPEFNSAMSTTSTSLYQAHESYGDLDNPKGLSYYSLAQITLLGWSIVVLITLSIAAFDYILYM